LEVSQEELAELLTEGSLPNHGSAKLLLFLVLSGKATDFFSPGACDFAVIPVDLPLLNGMAAEII